MLESFRIKAEESHLQLAWSCLDCMHSGLHGSRTVEWSTIRVKTLRHSLLVYAVQRWPVYARGALGLADQLIEHSSRFFERNCRLRDNRCLIYREQDNWVRTDALQALHIACYSGVIPWVQSLLYTRVWNVEIRKSVNNKDSQGRSVLTCTALKGYGTVVRLLLDRRADVNAKNNGR